MMYRLCVALLTLACVANAAETGAVCTASGDPHWTTFDKVRHDFQGMGPFMMAEQVPPANSDLETLNRFIQQFRVQVKLSRCNGANNRVSCIRWIAISLRAPTGGETFSLRWGYQWRDPNTYQNSSLGPIQEPFPTAFYDSLTVSNITRVIPDKCGLAPAREVPGGGSSCPCRRSGVKAECPNNVAINSQITLEGGQSFTIIKASGSLKLIHSMGMNITFTPASFSMVVRKSEPFLMGTNGLCGYFDGLSANEFVNASYVGVRSIDTTKGDKVNSPKFYQWGNQFAGSPIIEPLPAITSGQAGHLMAQEDNTIFIPNQEDIDRLANIQVDNVFVLKKIKDDCENLVKGIAVDDAAKAAAQEDCIFDGTALANGDPALTQVFFDSTATALRANEAAALLVSEDAPSDNSLTNGQIAAISVSVFAAIFAIVATVLYYRLHKTKQSLSRALILVQPQASGFGPRSDSTEPLAGGLHVASNI